MVHLAENAGRYLDKAERNRAEARSKRAHCELLGATLELSQVREWTAFVKKIGADVQEKMRLMLALQDDGELGVVDRKRAVLTAEINLLGVMAEAPKLAQDEINRLQARIAALEQEADEIEKTYSFAKGA